MTPSFYALYELILCEEVKLTDHEILVDTFKFLRKYMYGNLAT